jgi:NDP-sugar pyrophosphorylase family protein/lipopolysaccharide/colanic/teichoic acid biosynthesis glycosyltransferase
MHVLLLATGESRKCWPLTASMPSPMLPILNRPVMSYAIELLVRQQIRQIHVGLYEQAATIEAYFGNGRRWGASLEYHLQRQAWGDAGAMRWAFPAADDRVLVIPADTLIDLDIQALLESHQAQGAALTRVVCPIEDARKETGVYLLEPEALALIPPRTTTSITGQLIPGLQRQGGQLGEYIQNGYWNSLENFRQYSVAAFDLLQYAEVSAAKSDDTEPMPGALRFLTVEGRRHSPGIWIGRNNAIHPSAQLAPPIYIHENNQIGRNVSLGPAVVLGENVIIDQEATLRDAIVLADTYVGQLLQIEERLVHQNLLVNTETGEYTRVTDQHLLAGIYPDLKRYGLQRVFDFSVALLALVLSSPLLVLCGLLLKLTGNPVFDRQRRWHKGGQGQNASENLSPEPFELLRFTTRHPDGMLTGIGGWLEAFELNRLPEWISVLKGDCSMVGVKPLSGEEAASLREEWQHQRFAAPAGITGLWYLRTSSESSLDEVLINDAYYVATRSGWGDLRILLETPAAWLQKVTASARFASSAGGKV